jgi:hypothetical protein
MPKRAMVGISFYIPLETLEKIQNLKGKSQSEKIRKLLEKALGE